MVCLQIMDLLNFYNSIDKSKELELNIVANKDGSSQTTKTLSLVPDKTIRWLKLSGAVLLMVGGIFI